MLLLFENRSKIVLHEMNHAALKFAPKKAGLVMTYNNSTPVYQSQNVKLLGSIPDQTHQIVDYLDHNDKYSFFLTCKYYNSLYEVAKLYYFEFSLVNTCFTDNLQFDFEKLTADINLDEEGGGRKDRRFSTAFKNTSDVLNYMLLFGKSEMSLETGWAAVYVSNRNSKAVFQSENNEFKTLKTRTNTKDIYLLLREPHLVFKQQMIAYVFCNESQHLFINPSRPMSLGSFERLAIQNLVHCSMFLPHETRVEVNTSNILESKNSNQEVLNIEPEKENLPQINTTEKGANSFTNTDKNKILLANSFLATRNSKAESELQMQVMSLCSLM